LISVIRYILKYFDTNIHVLEACYRTNDFLQLLLPKEVKYTFWDDDDPIFHRTKYINIMVERSITKFIGVVDSDVIIPHKQIDDTIEKLRSDRYDMVYPYDGNFKEASQLIRKVFLHHHDEDYLFSNTDKMSDLYGFQTHVGGAFFVNKNKYIQAGMENEKYYGWGPEDFERNVRWQKHGFNIYRSDGSIIHLTHPRDHNGHFHSDIQEKYLNNELDKLVNSKKISETSHIALL
jgi:hypothetical protein